MKKAILYLAVISCIGCGVRFKNAPYNLILPDYFKTRNLYEKTDIWRFKIPELAGSIISGEPGSASYDRVRRIVKEGYVAKLEVIQDSERKVYSSKIDQGFALGGSYLVFAADIKADQMAEVNIEDMSLVFINDADIPWEELVAEANKPNPNPAARRYWIQAALLSGITITYFEQISANASGIVGETFKANGNVYSKQSGTTRDFKISLELIDIDKLSRSTRDASISDFKKAMDPEIIKTLLSQSLERGLMLKDIKKD